jgi:ATP-dependent Clp protease protease subunit
MTNNDFRNYAIKHRKISSTFYDSYSKVNTTQHILDDVSEGIMVDIFSKLLDSRIIFLSTEMESDICNIVKAQLLYLEQLDSEKDIKIYIDSPGGCVYSGLGLLDTMEYIKPEIVTINTGLAASMAAVLLCSGTKGKRKALKRSRTMIHQPMSGSYGMYQASDLSIDAKEINSLKYELYDIISDRTGQSFKKVEQDADRDYWMTSEESLKYGMIDEVIIKKK